MTTGNPAWRAPRTGGAISGGSLTDHVCVYSVDCGNDAELNEDYSSALLEFGSGAHGIYTQVFYARRGAGTRGATVSGHLSTVSFDWYTNELLRIRHHAPFSALERRGRRQSLRRRPGAGLQLHRRHQRHGEDLHPDRGGNPERVRLSGRQGIGEKGPFRNCSTAAQ